MANATASLSALKMATITEECREYHETLWLIRADPDTSEQARKWADYILNKYKD